MKSLILLLLEKLSLTAEEREADYEKRKVGRDECKGITVSTCWSEDEGYETALLDRNGTYPVERYVTKEEAVKGHERWKKFAREGDGKMIVCLGGWGGIVRDEEVVLKAKES